VNDKTAIPERPEVVYHGLYRETGGSVVLIETPGGDLIGELVHVRKHSPTGMSWGYGGSGAADCARSLLIDALGEQASACPECAGTKVTVVDAKAGVVRAYDPAKDGPRESLDPELTEACWCDGGYRPLPHHAFKFAFLGREGDWRMRRSQILAWLAAQPGWS
jgi:Family of unknown function (DUF6166)